VGLAGCSISQFARSALSISVGLSGSAPGTGRARWSG